jgi:uncharacterized protein (DUF2384 family)
MDPESELRRIEIFKKAIGIFGDPSVAKRWMSCPVPSLEGLTPLQLATRVDGVELAADILFQIKNGVYC